MDEIMMWSVEQEGSSLTAKKLDAVSQMDTESQLEDLLVRNPEVLMPNLRLIGRQNPIQGGFLDLLGIDENGNLVVFELKRGSLSREAIAQSIDYASCLDQMTRETLAQHISERSGTGGIEKIEDFDSWYQEGYPNDPYGYTNHPRIVLVGLGADETTERMAAYLAQSNLDISLITFHGFTIDGKKVLAKHIKVKAPESGGGDAGGYTKTANLKALKELADKTGSAHLFNVISAFIHEIMPGYQYPTKSGYTFSLMEQTEQGTPSYRAYVSLYLNEKKRNQVQMVFWKRGVDLAQDTFETLQQKPGVSVASSGNIELWIKSISEFESFRDDMKKLLSEIVNQWNVSQLRDRAIMEDLLVDQSR